MQHGSPQTTRQRNHGHVNKMSFSNFRRREIVSAIRRVHPASNGHLQDPRTANGRSKEWSNRLGPQLTKGTRFWTSIRIGFSIPPRKRSNLGPGDGRKHSYLGTERMARSDQSASSSNCRSRVDRNCWKKDTDWARFARWQLGCQRNCKLPGRRPI